MESSQHLLVRPDEDNLRNERSRLIFPHDILVEGWRLWISLDGDELVRDEIRDGTFGKHTVFQAYTGRSPRAAEVQQN